MRAALLLALLAAAPSAGWARAGGGDDYSSGSSDSGSSYSSDSGSSYSSDSSYSSSSGGAGAAVQMPDWLAYVLLAVIVLLLLMLVWMVIVSIVKGPPPRLEERDRRAAAFLAVQRAWSDGDMTPVARHLSDGVFERFQTLLAMNKADGKVNVVSDVSISACEAAYEGKDGGWERADLRITAGCLDVYLDLDRRHKLKGGQTWFTEYWGFLRRTGAKEPGAELPEHACPNCGQAVAVNRTAVCPNCKSWLNSGEHDWVLAEITQQDEWSEWDAQSHGSALAPLRRSDPELSAQELEDRASALFWRWQACLVERSPTRLEGVATPELLAALPAQGLGKHRFYDVGVGGVSVRQAAEAGGTQTVRVSVKWRGRRGDSGGSVLSRTFLTFSRKAGVLTLVKAGLRSLHCAGCGAAQEPAQAVCGQCGRAFNDPALGWVLSGLETVEERG